ncbi:MAG: hypothetical protein J6T97_02050 [Bacteroidaceae bacterium]|nr:hypothetical protein [Bacteroidaceae bacterium]
MKRILCFAIAFLSATMTFAQTGAEIVNRMNERINARRSEGISVIAEVKIPIVGTVLTKTSALGDRRRVDVRMKERDVITFSQQDTTWIYTVQDNSVLITTDTIMSKVNSSNPEGNIDMFGDIVEVYNITIKSQNLVKWELVCKRKKGNKDDDYPKNITLEVRKDTYELISMTTKMMGISMVMRDLKFGLTQKDVTFNQANYPGVKVTDQR